MYVISNSVLFPDKTPVQVHYDDQEKVVTDNGEIYDYARKAGIVLTDAKGNPKEHVAALCKKTSISFTNKQFVASIAQGETVAQTVYRLENALKQVVASFFWASYRAQPFNLSGENPLY